MGIDARDGSTNMERLLKIADKFHDMADGPTKVALSMQLLGRSGKEAIPFLNQGSAAIQQLMDKSKELGAVNEAAVEQGARLASSVNESKVAWEGLKQTLTQAFGPLMTELVDGFSALVKSMHDSYESGGLVKIIFDAIGEVVRGLGEIASRGGQTRRFQIQIRRWRRRGPRHYKPGEGQKGQARPLGRRTARGGAGSEENRLGNGTGRPRHVPAILAPERGRFLG
jgi:hypothetical protein